MIIDDPKYIALVIIGSLFFYFIPKGQSRPVLLLIFSYLYYLTFPPSFFLFLLFITFTAFKGGILLENKKNTSYQSWFLFVIISLMLLPLCIYKYLIPIIAHTHKGSSWDLTMAQIVAPVGISFYTFAALGYVIDVALQIIPAERNFLRVALFCAFFPYVTAGPIPRSMSILPQLNFQNSFSADRAMQGFTEILIGATMKLWIADTLSMSSSAVYNDFASCIPLEKLVATFFFSFQLYADFAGYSLIAIGSARLFGINVPDNFRQPYLSKTIAEFWKRWHISLLGWLRDYVFMPLQLQWRHSGLIGTSCAMSLTLLLVGIWHGAGWGFIVFGLVHGLLLTISQLTLGYRDKFWLFCRIPIPIINFSRIMITFVIVSITMILFRASHLTEALSIYHAIFSIEMLQNLWNLLTWQPSLNFRYIHIDQNCIDILLICFLIIGDILASLKPKVFMHLPSLVKAPIYAVLMFTLLYQVIDTNATKPFVYFQF